MTFAASELRLTSVEISDDTIITHMLDGRSIRVPMVWSWR
jgi:hypothetical protein